jgi:FkbM family methyltransferase
MREEKRTIKAAIREHLYGSPVFFPVRTAYQCIFDRAKLVDRRQMRDFYAPFVRRGDLVFDVGAHFGKYAECFTSLGATVIAIEPNPSCCDSLRQLARSRNMHVENCAVGDQPGKVKLHICVEYPSLSTVTSEWYEAAQNSPLQHRNAHWQEPIEVDVVTLDQLSGRYGVPSFVKIDVEGFDDHVLRGMSFQPRALSFEFNREVPQVAERCFDAPVLASGYEFNYTSGTKLSCAQWMDAKELRSQIFNAERYFGDVVARRVSRSKDADRVPREDLCSSLTLQGKAS